MPITRIALAQEFYNAVKAARLVNELTATHLHQYEVEDYRTMRCHLAVGGLAGYAIREDGELVNVFNTSPLHGLGWFLVQQAINGGATHLDCFDGFLPVFYASLGFVEYKREANWTPGEPDVVFMRIKPDEISP